MRAAVLTLSSLLLVPFVHAAPETVDVPLATTDWIVGFDTMPEDVREGEAYGGGTVLRVDEPLAFAVVRTENPALLRLAAALDERVRYIEWDDPAFAIVRLVPNDARYGDAGHYGSKKIGAEKAWDRTTGTTAVKVAVIDSGLRKTHEEFAGSGRVLQGWDFVNNDNNPEDNCGHGTHVTGTIAATIGNGKGIAGLAQASILPIRGLSATLILCTGSTSGLASALRFAGDQGAHLASNSWGGGSATAIDDAITYAKGKGVTIVAAAGNDGSCTNCVSAPWKANAAKVIVVSSTDQNDALSSFSSQGPEVDVAAPGTSILSSYNSNDASYSSLSGTSMATPHVTGTLALVLALNPSFGYADLDSRIKTTAVDLGAAGKDDKFGYGRINADAATAGGTPPPPPPPPPTNTPPTASFTHTESGLATNVNGGGSSDSDGTVVAWSWSWGDGTPAGSGTTTSHAYAAAGTYTVTLTVTDDDGATASTSQSVSVSAPSDPDPSVPTLANGVARSDTSGASGTEKLYKVQVPAGRPSLTVVLDGPACGGLLGCTPDLDLYVKRGAKPTDTSYDCRPYEGDSDETCTLSGPAADWWYIRVKVYAGSNAAYTIRATY
ncbi:MAG TPA: S8 family serine peptidase [Candidatus Thermoplasmatota archaeon]|nr:S8 family serine peptidase [Candidatus Thermoplasmatota archaeon]